MQLQQRAIGSVMNQPTDTADVIAAYYAAFNRQDPEGMLGLLADDVVHEPSQGEPRRGKQAFADFLAHMNRCYRETVIDPAIMVTADGLRASAEFMLEGRYLETDAGLPTARGRAIDCALVLSLNWLEGVLSAFPTTITLPTGRRRSINRPDGGSSNNCRTGCVR